MKENIIVEKIVLFEEKNPFHQEIFHACCTLDTNNVEIIISGKGFFSFFVSFQFLFE